MRGKIRGTLSIVHKDEPLHEFTKEHRRSFIIVPFATLIGTSVYYLAEFKGGSSDDLRHFFRTLDRDPYVLNYRIIERRANQARLIVTRRQMGTLKALCLTDSVLNGPIVIKNGVRYYPVVTFSRNLKQLLTAIKENAPTDTEVWLRVDDAIVNEVDPYKTFTTAQDMVSKLSYMELKSLITAFQLGYFNWPRYQDSREVSKYLGISRSTFIEHLRKAERKIIKSIMESLDVTP
ncbi:MAG: helix-turn-helix domain-containing protein [Zestosphaera sp.]